MKTAGALLLGIAIALGVAAAGYLIGNGWVAAKELERTVTVKGLSEREAPADIAIWPLTFNVADNNLETLVKTVELQTQVIIAFLAEAGFEPAEITINPPAITDKQAQNYGNDNVRFRYLAQTTITVYSRRIEATRAARTGLLDLGKAGITIAQDNYDTRTQYLFEGLNLIKPEMIEEATRNARAVAQKFAEDSGSTLGKIRKARQGQFSISDRDSNNPHIKKIRVVSTLEYYLAD
ncbi:MAG: SIMPL domain-containing protein [Pseudomonadales bacterium]